VGRGCAPPEHDRVDPVQRVRDRLGQLREHQRQAAGQVQRTLDADPAIVSEVMHADRQADDGTPLRRRGGTVKEIH